MSLFYSAMLFQREVAFLWVYHTYIYVLPVIMRVANGIYTWREKKGLKQAKSRESTERKISDAEFHS